MTKVSFYAPGEIPDSQLEYVVIAARFQNQWIFSRHKQRSTWEIPGGHREPGEAVDDAANRELWEETGAVKADVQRICVYGVTKDRGTNYGMLYYAEVSALDRLPENFEMAEVLLTDRLPEGLTYPDIQPKLFEKVQAWLNLQSSLDELWDVYDKNRNLTGRLHRWGDAMKPGQYHLVVHVWIMNSKGQFLLTKRSSNKGFPNIWESTCGSALAGDDSLAAALREVKEETGLTLDPNKGQRVFTMHRDDYFRDVWLFRQDFSLEDVVLQSGETTDKMYADGDTIRDMMLHKRFVPCDYLEALLGLTSVIQSKEKDVTIDGSSAE